MGDRKREQNSRLEASRIGGPLNAVHAGGRLDAS
jgi:hypothetical protein